MKREYKKASVLALFFATTFWLAGCEPPQLLPPSWEGPDEESPNDPNANQEGDIPSDSVLTNLQFTNVNGSPVDTGDVNTGADFPSINLSFTDPEASAQKDQYLWVKESNLVLDLQIFQSAEWSIQVVRGKTMGSVDSPSQPAQGVKVSVELQSPNTSKKLDGVVGPDGWVKWTTGFPETNTFMYIRNIEGAVPWAFDDKAFWTQKDKSILSYTGTEPTE